jgi:hypothetical protein
MLSIILDLVYQLSYGKSGSYTNFLLHNMFTFSNIVLLILLMSIEQ